LQRSFPVTYSYNWTFSARSRIFEKTTGLQMQLGV
jgi:hypothetical protein